MPYLAWNTLSAGTTKEKQTESKHSNFEYCGLQRMKKTKSLSNVIDSSKKQHEVG
jgi:hypothetical protein